MLEIGRPHMIWAWWQALVEIFVERDACFRKEGNRHGKMERHLQVCNYNFGIRQFHLVFPLIFRVLYDHISNPISCLCCFWSLRSVNHSRDRFDGVLYADYFQACRLYTVYVKMASSASVEVQAACVYLLYFCWSGIDSTLGLVSSLLALMGTWL